MLIDQEEVEGVESDSIIFIPQGTKLTIKNNSKYSSAIMKIQITVYTNNHTN